MRFIRVRRNEKFGFITESWGKSSLGARLRTRKVRGRDAALPAPLLAASLGLVGRGTVGALPQTPQGTLSLDPARGNFPLDPSARLSWSRFHAPSACSFLGLRLSPCLLPKLSVKNQNSLGNHVNEKALLGWQSLFAYPLMTAGRAPIRRRFRSRGSLLCWQSAL